MQGEHVVKQVMDLLPQSARIGLLAQAPRLFHDLLRHNVRGTEAIQQLIEPLPDP